MKISRSALDQAVAHHVITGQQAESLWNFLSEDQHEKPSFQATHVI